jgi:Predicted membrane protein
MPTLFVRTLIVYLLMFAVLRLMGKRQINDMQPFDLAVTLLIANLASVPMGDPAVPLAYGVIPMLGMFIIHRLVSFASLKSEKLRKAVCGSPLVIISRGVVREDVMRAANYSLSDLTEQLRLKEIFSLASVEYAILETNGSLSVLLKGPFQTPTNEQLGLESEKAAPELMLVMDGKIHERELESVGLNARKLKEILKKMKIGTVKECFFASLDSSGMLHAQRRLGFGGSCEAHFMPIEKAMREGEKKNG